MTGECEAVHVRDHCHVSMAPERYIAVFHQPNNSKTQLRVHSPKNKNDPIIYSSFKP